jgi:aconitate hydratase
VAAVSALKGELTDPRSFDLPTEIQMPEVLPAIDHLFVWPSDHAEAVDVVRGPNIKPLPGGRAMPETIEGEVLIRLGDDITTDDIMPAGAHIMSLRSNIPAISEYVFSRLEPDFAKTARDKGGGFVVAGRNYGQGSSREHAALAPMVLGIKGVIARSFARIHRANLINFGILPMTFMTDDELERIQSGDHLSIEGILTLLKKGSALGVVNTTQGGTFEVRVDLDPREKDVVMSGGLLEFLRQQGA